jgi:hypothetical protein
VNADRLDWELFLSQAEEFEWSSAALAAFFEVTSLFGTPIPEAILVSLAAQSDQNTGRITEMQHQAATHTLEEYQKFKSLKGRGRVKLVLGLVFPGPSYIRWRYGVKQLWTLPFWYLYRWWGIFMDTIRTVGLLVQKEHPGGTLDKSFDRNESSS